MKSLMTTNEVAEILKVNQDTVQRYVKNGQLEAIRLNGKFLRIKPDSLERLISNATIPTMKPNVNSKDLESK